jgi:hypothetical protein
MQKLKRHGNGGSCLKKHEKLKIKIFAERVMESMYSKTCPIPVKNVRDKLIEMTPLSSLLSDWYIQHLSQSKYFGYKNIIKIFLVCSSCEFVL